MQAADDLFWKLTKSEIFSDDKDLCFRIVGLVVVESSELRCLRGVKLRALLGNNTKVCVECCRLSAVFRSISNDTGKPQDLILDDLLVFQCSSSNTRTFCRVDKTNVQYYFRPPGLRPTAQFDLDRRTRRAFELLHGSGTTRHSPASLLDQTFVSYNFSPKHIDA